MTQPTPTPPLSLSAAPVLLADIMTRAIAHLGSTAPLAQAAQCMAQAGISCVVVMEAGKPVGILTEQDMLRLF